MAAADLQGPLDDFLERTSQIKSIIVAIEAAAKSPGALTTTRHGVDLAKIGGQTENTVNSMALIFLASSFEEFVREEVKQCAGYMADRYAGLADDIRHKVRNAYWGASLDRLRYTKSILTKKKPRVPDIATMSNVRVLLHAAHGFVVGDDARLLEVTVFGHHSNNFKPHVVDEIMERLGICSLFTNIAESSKIKSYFGVTKKSDANEKLRSKLNEFYDRRNETVHSLNGSTGYAASIILDYIEIFEATTDSMRHVLSKELAKW